MFPSVVDRRIWSVERRDVATVGGCIVLLRGNLGVSGNRGRRAEITPSRNLRKFSVMAIEEVAQGTHRE